MKTNLSSLMNMQAKYQEEYDEAAKNVLIYSRNIKTRELNGTETMLYDCKDDFNDNFEKLKKLEKVTSKIRATINKMNNEIKLSDNRTISEALADNISLRIMQDTYKSLLETKASNKRVTEVNNSYFEIKELNFDSKNLKDLYNEVTKKILDTDFEISKANSIEFDVDIDL